MADDDNPLHPDEQALLTDWKDAQAKLKDFAEGGLGRASLRWWSSVVAQGFAYFLFVVLFSSLLCCPSEPNRFWAEQNLDPRWQIIGFFLLRLVSPAAVGYAAYHCLALGERFAKAEYKSITTESKPAKGEVNQSAILQAVVTELIKKTFDGKR